MLSLLAFETRVLILSSLLLLLLYYYDYESPYLRKLYIHDFSLDVYIHLITKKYSITTKQNPHQSNTKENVSCRTSQIKFPILYPQPYEDIS